MILNAATAPLTPDSKHIPATARTHHWSDSSFHPGRPARTSPKSLHGHRNRPNSDKEFLPYRINPALNRTTLLQSPQTQPDPTPESPERAPRKPVYFLDIR